MTTWLIQIGLSNESADRVVKLFRKDTCWLLPMNKMARRNRIYSSKQDLHIRLIPIIHLWCNGICDALAVDMCIPHRTENKLRNGNSHRQLTRYRFILYKSRTHDTDALILDWMNMLPLRMKHLYSECLKLYIEHTRISIYGLDTDFMAIVLP